LVFLSCEDSGFSYIWIYNNSSPVRWKQNVD